ncbi:MAG: proteasome subunit alpha, partial [Nanoarchaeota archaeon]|nr:proteasome subunit alpha [Nanoarchaeota archaeon]
LDAIEKIFQIDDHIISTASGIISDARVLVERSQVKAQQHKVTYDTPIDTLSIVKDICNLKQMCTQSGGLRPFGVSLLVAGIDDNTPVLFETDPTGIYNQYLATAIGEGETEVKELLYKQYKEGLTIEEGLKICVKALKKVLNDDFNERRIDASFINKDKKVMEKVSQETIKKILK